MKKELGIFILLVALCAVTASINPRFLSQTNLTNMANLIGLFGVFSLGLGLLQRPHFGINAAVGQQIGVCAAFEDAAGAHDDDFVGIGDRRQPVRDDQRRAALRDAGEGGLDLRLGG